jgi:hypothetical protein
MNSTMKTFEQLREQTVYNKKIKNVPVKIEKKGSKFIAYVDGDMLDTYSSQKEAEKMATEFVKQYKG